MPPPTRPRVAAPQAARPPTPGPAAFSVGVALHFSHPRGVAVDGEGNLYVADYSDAVIYKVTPQGQVTLAVGATVKPGGVGHKVEMSTPCGVAVDKDGTIYVADADGNTVWKIPATGDVVGFKGKSGSPGDKAQAGADFAGPTCLALDQSGNLLVGDTHAHAVRKIYRNGLVVTFAGQPTADSASVDGLGGDARFGGPRGIAVDGDGMVYVADEEFDTVRKITSDSVVSTVAGGLPVTVNAPVELPSPRGLAVDFKGNIYVACTDDNLIRKIAVDRTVTTLAGKAGEAGTADGKGDAARFAGPRGLAADLQGNVYVADSDNGLIRKISPDGTVATVRGTPLN